MSLEAQRIGFRQHLQKLRLPCQEDFSLSEITTVRIGSRVAFRVQPEIEDQVMAVAQAAKACELPVWIHGQGSNCLFVLSSDPYPGVLIQWLSQNQSLPEPPDAISDVFLPDVHTGTRKITLGRYCLAHGLEAGAWLCGIPGTLGGGIAMNAGTRQGEFKDIITQIRRADLKRGVIETPTPGQSEFGYRHQTCCGPTQLLTAASFLLKRAQDVERFRQESQNHLKGRKDTQPLSAYSFGSAFKNPAGQHAAHLIEQAGLKGYRVGDAAISQKHANFFINLGQATAQDMVRLIEHTQAQVQKRFGLLLEPEVRVIREFYTL